MNYYTDAIKKYVVFEGRATRKEFWMFILFSLIITFVLSLLDSAMGTSASNTGGLLANIYTLAVFLPTLAIGIRRLHDTRRSGWWMLLALIPLIGTLILIVFWVQESKTGDNSMSSAPSSSFPPPINS